jgi:peptide/nickel transport system ATP-binding protein
MAGKCDVTVPARVRSDEIDVACLLYGEEEGR